MHSADRIHLPYLRTDALTIGIFEQQANEHKGKNHLGESDSYKLYHLFRWSEFDCQYESPVYW